MFSEWTRGAVILVRLETNTVKDSSANLQPKLLYVLN